MSLLGRLGREESVSSLLVLSETWTDQCKRQTVSSSSEICEWDQGCWHKPVGTGSSGSTNLSLGALSVFA